VDAKPDPPSAVVDFQYPTTGRRVCRVCPPRRMGGVQSTFSTLPRVVVSAGAIVVTRSVSRRGFFQYPTTGRRVCRPQEEEAAAAFFLPFSTLPRVVVSAGRIDNALQDGEILLSVPYHGSSCLPGSSGRSGRSATARLSVPYHGSSCLPGGSAVPRRGMGRNFQYPTTGRRVCRSTNEQPIENQIELSVPYHGSSCLPVWLLAPGTPGMSRLSVPYHGSSCLPVHAPMPSLLILGDFQYPTTGRRVCRASCTR